MLIQSPKHLAQFAQDHRKQQALTQSDVGERIQMKQGTISSFENRPDSTQLATLFRILSALDLEIHLVPKDAAKKDTSSTTGWTESW